MKKQTNNSLNTTFYFLRSTQIQDHFVPTRFTSPHPSALTSHRTFIRTTGHRRSLLESTLDAALSCFCHTSLVAWPVLSVHLFFPGRQVLFIQVSFEFQVASLLRLPHDIEWLVQTSVLHPHQPMPVSQQAWTSTLLRLGCCFLRTRTRAHSSFISFQIWSSSDSMVSLSCHFVKISEISVDSSKGDPFS